MSLDYPFYEELRRRKHWAAWWWLVGDRLYYLGLLPALLALPNAALFGVAWLLGRETLYGTLAWLCAFSFPVAVLIALLGGRIKRHAYTLAQREGIPTDPIGERTRYDSAP